MSYTKRVVLAFAAFGKSADAFVNPVGMKICSSACQNFMPICLVAHIPYQLIIGSIKNVVNSNGQFNNSQARSKMSALFRHHINNELAQLLAKLWQLLFFQFTKV